MWLVNFPVAQGPQASSKIALSARHGSSGKGRGPRQVAKADNRLHQKSPKKLPPLGIGF